MEARHSHLIASTPIERRAGCGLRYQALRHWRLLSHTGSRAIDSIRLAEHPDYLGYRANGAQADGRRGRRRVYHLR
jgi:hypothetical protein